MMSQAVVRQEWRLLDDLFRRDLLQSLLVFLAGALGLLACYHLLALVDSKYIDRILPFWQFVGLLCFVFLYHVNGSLSAQLRSFRREPLAWVSVVGSLIIITGSVIEARNGSIGGVVLVMLATQACFIFPLSFLLWRRYNRLWRNEVVL